MSNSLSVSVCDPLSWIDRFFDDEFERSLSFPRTMARSMRYKVVEEKDHVVLHIEAPGLKKEDLKVNVQSNVLKVSYDVSKEKNIVSFSKSGSVSFELRDDVRTDEVDAAYEAGILTLRLSKEAKRTPQTREVIVK